MKVLHVINSLSIGGAEKLIVDIVPEQVRKGNVVDVALLSDVNTSFKVQLANTNSCRIFDLSSGSVYNPMLIFKLIPVLKDYDLIHVHLFPAQYLVVLAKIFGSSRGQLIFTEHNTFNTRMKYWILRMFDKIIYKYYSSIICITEEVKDALKKKYSLPDRKLRVINNGINLEMAKLSSPYHRNDFGFKTSDILIVMVAAFREQKDHLCLINSLSLLPDQYKLILIGEGYTMKQIKGSVEYLDLQSRVSFWGVRTDVYKILKMCDIGVLSSRWEGFGIAAVEYMACGLPAVVSDVAGLSDIVGDNGVKFESGNHISLASSIKSLWEHKTRYAMLTELGRERSELFSLSTMVNTIDNSYRQLCKL